MMVPLQTLKRYFADGTIGSLTDEYIIISVNPDHVTLIEPHDIKSQEGLPPINGCKLWVKSNSGYGTASFFINSTVEEVTNLLNNSQIKIK